MRNIFFSFFFLPSLFKSLHSRAANITATEERKRVRVRERDRRPLDRLRLPPFFPFFVSPARPGTRFAQERGNGTEMQIYSLSVCEPAFCDGNQGECSYANRVARVRGSLFRNIFKHSEFNYAIVRALRFEKGRLILPERGNSRFPSRFGLGIEFCSFLWFSLLLSFSSWDCFNAPTARSVGQWSIDWRDWICVNYVVHLKQVAHWFYSTIIKASQARQQPVVTSQYALPKRDISFSVSSTRETPSPLLSPIILLARILITIIHPVTFTYKSF